MRLSDFPIFQRFVNCYEFARLNKVTIQYIPKANMQLNLNTSSATQTSVTGTLITAIDQVPLVAFYAGATAIVAAPTWITDADADANVTVPFAASCAAVTPTYVRGLESSRECEFYKRQVLSFYPAFYDYVLDNPIVNTTTGAGNTGTFGNLASNSGCFERKIKKWVNITTLTQTASSSGTGSSVANAGPVYYGPVYALDINQQPVSSNPAFPLFDVRMTYSMSFKRLKGAISNLV